MRSMKLVAFASLLGSLCAQSLDRYPRVLLAALARRSRASRAADHLRAALAALGRRRRASRGSLPGRIRGVVREPARAARALVACASRGARGAVVRRAGAARAREEGRR